MSDEGKTDFKISGQKLLLRFKRITGSLLVLTQPSRDCGTTALTRINHAPFTCRPLFKIKLTTSGRRNMEHLDRIKLSILMKGRGKIENYGFRA